MGLTAVGLDTPQGNFTFRLFGTVVALQNKTHKMRKIIAVAALMLATIACHAQVHVQKYRCFRSKLVYTDESKPKTEWEKVDILWTFDLDKSKIHVYSNRELDIAMISHKPIYKDAKGQSNLDFDGLDEENLKCYCSIVFNNGGTVTLFVIYNDFCFIYESIVI